MICENLRNLWIRIETETSKIGKDQGFHLHGFLDSRFEILFLLSCFPH
jgi:hypothetical protein